MEREAYLLLGWCISGFIDDVLSRIRYILGNVLGMRCLMLLMMWRCVMLRCWVVLWSCVVLRRWVVYLQVFEISIA